MTAGCILANNGNVRLQRARIARSIANLLDEKLAHDFDGEDWAMLDTLPDWMTLTDEALLQLVLIAGAMLLQQRIKLSINGSLLRQTITLLGDECFKAILNAELPEVPVFFELSPNLLKQTLVHAGSSVLLAVVCSPSYQAVMQARLEVIVDVGSGDRLVDLREDVAQILLENAVKLLNRPTTEVLV